MKKALITLFVAFISLLQCQAVLKEKDVNKTLHVLRLELYNKYKRQRENMISMEERSKAQHDNLVKIIERCQSTSLMLYSQNQDFTLDVAYACQEATNLYHEMHMHTMPYDQIKMMIHTEIQRYDSLICVLKRMPPVYFEEQDSVMKAEYLAEVSTGEVAPVKLNKEGIRDRNVCILYATILKNNLEKVNAKVTQDQAHYVEVKDKVERLNKYALDKYTALQQSIFINPGTNYFRILAMFPYHWKRMTKDFQTKYTPLYDEDDTEKEHVYKSEWRGGIVLFATTFMIVYIIGASLLSFLLLKFCVPKKKRTEKFFKKRPLMIMSLAIILFSFGVMIARFNIENHNLMMMATGLMIEMAWLLLMVAISHLIRLKGSQVKATMKVYAPFIVMAVSVICFRIMLIPNTLVNMIFPPMLLIASIWQGIVMNATKKELQHSDRLYIGITMAVMVGSCILSWIGYTLLSVQILMWWMFQTSAIATINTCYELMEMFENRVLEKHIKKAYDDSVSDTEIRIKMKRGEFVDKTWLYDFINRALVPVCAVFSLMFTIFMAAELFNLRDLCMQWTFHEFHIKGFFSASIFKICLIGAMYFVFRYLNYLVRSSWFRYKKVTKENKNFNETLSRNIIGIVIWGAYIVTAFIMLEVPSTGILYILTGLTTGLGFASQSILENFFYGISLMSGRLRVGDYIECEGITGKVESITYQSTQIVTLDGSVITFRNSDLFTKNFKNMTRNHQYELIKIPFGVAYGSNVDDIRKMILEGTQTLNNKTNDGRFIINPNNKIDVAFSDFGASSVDLFLVVWVLVDQKIAFVAKAKEMIYKVLNEHNIEIPFPQQDIYIRSITKAE